MPILLDGSHPPQVRVQIGDVLMVAREMEDDEGKPFVWRYFFVVTKASRNLKVFSGIRIGSDDCKEFDLPLRRVDYTAHWLEPDEWPDGVHAFRTKLILEGRIEGLI